MNFEKYNPHIVAGLLKAFFIELPEPLLTFDLYDNFIDVPLGPLFYFSNNCHGIIS